MPIDESEKIINYCERCIYTPTCKTRKITMKKIITAKWLGQGRDDEVIMDSFNDVLDLQYVGFVPEQDRNKKCILITRGTLRGIAICNRPEEGICAWTGAKESQINQVGTYYIFETYSDILDWSKSE